MMCFKTLSSTLSHSHSRMRSRSHSCTRTQITWLSSNSNLETNVGHIMNPKSPICVAVGNFVTQSTGFPPIQFSTLQQPTLNDTDLHLYIDPIPHTISPTKLLIQFQFSTSSAFFLSDIRSQTDPWFLQYPNGNCGFHLRSCQQRTGT